MRHPLSTTVAACLALAALSLGTSVHAADLVTNGGFETGDFTGWTAVGPTAFNGVDATTPHSGTYAAYFGSVGATSGITEVLATTPGASYTVSFWLANEADALGDVTPNAFAFSWNGATRASLTDSAAFDYTQFSYLLTATGTTTSLSFSFQHDTAFWDLDDVSVTPVVSVPEPGSMALLGAGMLFVVARARRALK